MAESENCVPLRMRPSSITEPLRLRVIRLFPAALAPKILAVSMGLFAIAPQAAVAQRSQGLNDVGFWVSGAAGLSTPYEFGVAGTAAVRYKRVFVRTRYSTAVEFLGDWNEDVGILAGAVLATSRRAQVAAGAGVGRMTGTRGCVLCGNSDIPAVTAFLADLEARWALTRFFGLSAYMFVDFNRTESFGGLAGGLFIGVL